MEHLAKRSVEAQQFVIVGEGDIALPVGGKALSGQTLLSRPLGDGPPVLRQRLVQEHRHLLVGAMGVVHLGDPVRGIVREAARHRPRPSRPGVRGPVVDGQHVADVVVRELQARQLHLRGVGAGLRISQRGRQRPQGRRGGPRGLPLAQPVVGVVAHRRARAGQIAIRRRQRQAASRVAQLGNQHALAAADLFQRAARGVGEGLFATDREWGPLEPQCSPAQPVAQVEFGFLPEPVRGEPVCQHRRRRAGLDQPAFGAADAAALVVAEARVRAQVFDRHQPADGGVGRIGEVRGA